MSKPIIQSTHLSGVLQPTLPGNHEMPPTGCYNMKNKNVERAGVMQGGYHATMKHTRSQSLGPKSGYMGVVQGTNCGTVNPNHLGVAQQTGGSCGCDVPLQTGGSCGCSGETSTYGFTKGEHLGELRGSYAPVSRVSTCNATHTGGKRKKARTNTRRKKRKMKHSRSSRKGKRKTLKMKRKTRKGSRTYKQKRKSTRHSSRSRNTRKKRYSLRKHMKGGYQQLGTDKPFSTMYSAPVSINPSNSALANHVPIKRHMISRDNYNHFTKKGSMSPILDKAVQSS